MPWMRKFRNILVGRSILYQSGSSLALPQPCGRLPSCTLKTFTPPVYLPELVILADIMLTILMVKLINLQTMIIFLIILNIKSLSCSISGVHQTFLKRNLDFSMNTILDDLNKLPWFEMLPAFSHRWRYSNIDLLFSCATGGCKKCKKFSCQYFLVFLPSYSFLKIYGHSYGVKSWRKSI